MTYTISKKDDAYKVALYDDADAYIATISVKNASKLPALLDQLEGKGYNLKVTEC